MQGSDDASDTASPSNAPRVGVIGLGAMGAGMARALRRAGFAVHLYDVRPEAVGALVTEGGVASA
jgi:3-hydroxyisobutyrate dehydrogenase